MMIHVVFIFNISQGLSKDSFTKLSLNEQTKLRVVRYMCSGKKNGQNNFHASDKEKNCIAQNANCHHE